MYNYLENTEKNVELAQQHKFPKVHPVIFVHISKNLFYNQKKICEKSHKALSNLQLLIYTSLVKSLCPCFFICLYMPKTLNGIWDRAFAILRQFSIGEIHCSMTK
jgi:hypothetical protein